MLDRHNPAAAIPELERRLRLIERGSILDNEVLSHIKELTAQNMYSISITATRGNILKGLESQTMLIARLYSWDKDITDSLHSNKFVWTRESGNENADNAWNALHSIGEKYITLTGNDVVEQATFFCTVTDEAGNNITEQITVVRVSDGETGLPGKDGQDGYTPVKGIDYFDGKDGEQGIQGIQGEKGETGLPGKDGYTPFEGKYIYDENGEIEYEEIQVPVYEIVLEQVTDENGAPLLDEDGNPIYEPVQRQAVNADGEPVFTAQNTAKETHPEPPYKKGDIWITASGNVKYCIGGKIELESFDSNDWEESVTNSTLESMSVQIGAISDTVKSIQKDNGLSVSEIAEIKEKYSTLEGTVQSVVNGNYASLADLEEYKEYIKSIVDVTDRGVEVKGRNKDGEESRFKTILSNESLDFYENNIRTAYIQGAKFNIENGVIRNSLTVGKHIITTDEDSYEIEYLG